MVLRMTLAAAAAALLASAGAVAAPAPGDSRVLWRGPVLAGGGLLWSEEEVGTGALHLWKPARGDRVVYRSDSLALTRPLAASGDLLAFARTYPSCAPQPGVVCPQAEDILVGAAGGSFRRLVRPRVCSLPATEDTVALAAGVAAYIDVDCARNRLRVLARDVVRGRRGLVVGRPVVLADAPLGGGCCPAVAAAGRFVAWSDGRRAEVAVYDRVARRLVYRAPVGPVGIGVDLGFDLQADGTLAVAYRLTEVARAGSTTIAWFSPASPRPHVLPLRGRDTRVRIAGGRIALVRSVTARTSALVIADRAGRARTVARLAPPLRPRADFDFDGRRIAWASDRVTSTRTDCPPPGQGRPCVLRESGVTTIRLRGVAGGVARVVARLPFHDTLAHGPPFARYSSS